MTKFTIPIKDSYFGATLFFYGPSKTISETHWNTVTPSSDDTAYKAVLDEGAILGDLRIQMMGKDITDYTVRVSRANVYRDALENDYYDKNRPSWGDAEPGEMAALCRGFSTAQYHSKIFLSFMPDPLIVHHTFTGWSDAAWRPAFDAYVNQLTTHWGFLAKSNDPTDFPQVKITGMTFVVGPSNDTITILAVVPGLAVGDIVKIYNNLSILNTLQQPIKTGYFNQQYRVTSLVAGGFTVEVGGGETAGRIVKKFGVVQKQLRVLRQYTALTPGPLTGHRRGNRYFEPLGRSRSLKAAP
jgi:hypothetical protein